MPVKGQFSLQPRCLTRTERENSDDRLKNVFHKKKVRSAIVRSEFEISINDRTIIFFRIESRKISQLSCDFRIYPTMALLLRRPIT